MSAAAGSPCNGFGASDARCFRRWRSASACRWRAPGWDRHFRCRFAPCQRRTSPRHSGSWQYRWLYCLARNLRPHPFRKQLRHPSRFPLAETPLPVVRCACPTGGLAPLGQPGEESRPPRALLYRPMIPPAIAIQQPLPAFTAHSDEGHPPTEQQRPSAITRMADGGEGNKEGDGSDMRCLEGDGGRRPTSRRKRPEEGRLHLPLRCWR